MRRDTVVGEDYQGDRVVMYQGMRVILPTTFPGEVKRDLIVVLQPGTIERA